MPEQEKGILESLADFSFKEFVTPKLIKILYIVSGVFALVAALSLFTTGLRMGGPGILVGIIGAPIIFGILILMSRVWLELVIVIFSIEKHTKEMAGKK